MNENELYQIREHAMEFMRVIQTGGKDVQWSPVVHSIHYKRKEGLHTKVLDKRFALHMDFEWPFNFHDPRNYYTPCAVPTSTVKAQKFTRHDMSHSYYVWVDVDAPKYPEMTFEMYKDWRRGVLTNFYESILKPNIVMSSGIGIWGFWRLKEPEFDCRKLEKANEIMATHFWGDKAVKNIDRICRLPGFDSWKERWGIKRWKTEWQWLTKKPIDINDIFLIGKKGIHDNVHRPPYHENPEKKVKKPVITHKQRSFPSRKESFSKNKLLEYVRRKIRERGTALPDEDWSKGQRHPTAVPVAAYLLNKCSMPYQEALEYITGQFKPESDEEEKEVRDIMEWAAKL